MLLAIILPGLSLILNGHIFKGIVCILLQCTGFGWIPAAFWAVATRNNDLNEKRHKELMAAVKAGQAVPA